MSKTLGLIKYQAISIEDFTREGQPFNLRHVARTWLYFRSGRVSPKRPQCSQFLRFERAGPCGGRFWRSAGVSNASSSSQVNLFDRQCMTRIPSHATSYQAVTGGGIHSGEDLARWRKNLLVVSTWLSEMFSNFVLSFPVFVYKRAITLISMIHLLW